MARPWNLVARADGADGALELRQRGEDDFLITLAGRVLMNSRAQRSEIALGQQACEPVATAPRARVLVGGLGMGITLRAALDSLPRAARVIVAELNPVVGEWCAGPLAALNRGAVTDRRVTLCCADVAQLIAEAAEHGSGARYDAILLDLYEGPHSRTDAEKDPFYGRRALARTRAALRPGGVFAVWAENQVRSFEQRLRRAGFRVTLSRPGRGGLRHAVYLATAVEPGDARRRGKPARAGREG